MDTRLETVTSEIYPLGGFLVCDAAEPCRHRLPIGDPKKRDREGWPECCGKTMRWAVGSYGTRLGGFWHLNHNNDESR